MSSGWITTEEACLIYCTCLMTLYGVMRAHYILRSLYTDILCIQLIKLSNHEIMNHNPVIYLIECASCVLVYLCFDRRLSSLIQSASKHLLLPSVLLPSVNEC